MKVKVGDKLEGGQIYATLPETPIIEHRLMVHPELSGVVTKVMPDGQYKLLTQLLLLKMITVLSTTSHFVKNGLSEPLVL